MRTVKDLQAAHEQMEQHFTAELTFIKSEMMSFNQKLDELMYVLLYISVVTC